MLESCMQSSQISFANDFSFACSVQDDKQQNISEVFFINILTWSVLQSQLEMGKSIWICVVYSGRW